MKLLHYTFYYCFIYFLPAVVFAAPQISGVSGTLSDGENLILSGEGFGTGPTVFLFDQFEGEAGVDIPLDNAEKGQWSRYSHTPAYSGLDALSGTTSMAGASGGAMKQLRLDLPNITEAFVSFWVRIPDGMLFPAADTPGTLATRSSWKMVWLMDGSGGYHTDDNHFLPGWTGGNWVTVGSNNNVSNWYTQEHSPGGWWSFDKWMRISYWLKAGDSPAEDIGSAFIQMFSMGQAQHVYVGPSKRMGGEEVALFAPADLGNGIPRYTQVNLPGWIYAHRDEVVPLYDDFYISGGVNAAARLEMGDASEYSSCTKLGLLTPENWTGEKVEATFRLGPFSQGEDVFLFLVDSNNVASKGYGPVTIGSTIDTHLPEAVTNLRLVSE